MGNFLGIKKVLPPGFTYRQTVAEICRITEGHSYCTALARGSEKGEVEITGATLT